MRAAMVLAWMMAVVVMLLPWLRRKPGADRPRAIPDQLVKDPVCQTYIVRSRAVTRSQGGQAHYFCSARCADQFVLDRG